MFVLVITGGLGAGKSTAAEFFRERGASVIDLDQVARNLLSPGSPVLNGIAEAFGEHVVLPDGSLDRATLAACAFATKEDAATLDAIVHPAVVERTRELLGKLSSSQDPPGVVVIEVPLLVEAPEFAEVADEVLALVAPSEVRVERAIRRGMPRDDAERRVAAQAHDEERAALAGEVIINDSDERAFLGKLAEFWDSRIVPRAAC
jgi:dephospho-CoA kinase